MKEFCTACGEVARYDISVNNRNGANGSLDFDGHLCGACAARVLKAALSDSQSTDVNGAAEEWLQRNLYEPPRMDCTRDESVIYHPPCM